VLTVVTQNVDDLHQRAGNADGGPPARRHPGDRWLDPARSAAGLRPAAAPSRAAAALCRAAATCVRPGVVWFGESLPVGAGSGAERAAEPAR
jgi:NAD-dependent deacetylase